MTLLGDYIPIGYFFKAVELARGGSVANFPLILKDLNNL